MLACFLSLLVSVMEGDCKWKRKRVLRARAALMNAKRDCKQPLNLPPSGENSAGPSTEEHESSALLSTMDDSIQLPSITPDDVESSSESEEPFTPDAVKDVFGTWVKSLYKDDVRMMSVMFTDMLLERFHMTLVGAATETGRLVGYNEKTIRCWRKDFYENGGEFSDLQQGKHKRPYVLDDEECRHKALQWARENAYKKGEPNMTSSLFCEWVNNDLLPNSNLAPGFPRRIAPRTGARWLNDLGFPHQRIIKEYI